MKFFLSAMTVLAGILAIPSVVTAQDEKPGAVPRPSRSQLVEKHDTNKDGKLDQEERAAIVGEAPSGVRSPGRSGDRPKSRYTKELIGKYDIDKDGKLDPKETLTMRKEMRKKMKEITKRYDKNKDGQLDSQERRAFRSDVQAGKIKDLPASLSRRSPREGGTPAMTSDELLKRFDKDKDGKIDAKERESARQEARQIRSERKPPSPTE